MKLLLILFSVCAIGFSDGDANSAEISSEAKAKLHEVWGIDPEARRARLERISKKAAQQHNKTLATSLEKEILSVKLEVPYENAPVDLFELNNRLGVDKYLFQGDMHLTEEQLDAVERQMDEHGRSKRQAWTFANKWTGNTLYFYFDYDISNEKKTSVRAAHQYIESRTCINFVESRTARNRVRVYNGGGCQSSVGMVGNEQSLSLGDGCELVGITTHEFTHALGFFHMQSRSDRDSYVTVNDNNIQVARKFTLFTYSQPGAEGNFELLTPNENYIYTPYEYGSMMHYSANSFASPRNTFTITPDDMRYLYTMGNRQISFYDIQMINKFYNCGASCPAQNAPQCKNGGYPNPRDCSRCNCPAGYGGALCDQRPPGCGATFTATSQWQNGAIKVGDETNDRTSRNDFTTCTHWITAPVGKKIEVSIKSIDNGQCNYGCPFNGIEIKTENNTQVRNPLICCDEFTNKVFSSSQNPTPIVSFNRYWVSRFSISYRYVDGSSPQPAATTKAPAPTTNPSCFDRSGDACVRFVQRNGNCDALDPATARQYCAKTCGYCGALKTTAVPTQDPSCVDQSPDCARFAQIYGCQAFSPVAREQYCRKTCGYCGTKPITTSAPTCFDMDPRECARLFQTYGGCSRFFDALKQHYCPKMCGYCQ